MKRINIENFLSDFNREYKFLYEHSNVAGYDEAIAFGDKFLSNPQNRDFVGKFINYRCDLITSDREVAAFAFALEKYL